MNPPKVLVVVGPTATGKTHLAMRLAEELNGEVISADSRQIYRYMDIGTAKPSLGERAIIRHHLIDILDPDENYNLATFLHNARSLIRDIVSRSKQPIVAGGTGQYIRGLIKGWTVPKVPPNPSLRAELEQRARKEGVTALYKDLVNLDPVAARRIDQYNKRRIIRAIEVYSSLGKENVPQITFGVPLFQTFVVGLTLRREELYNRIDLRVDKMLEEGWIDEVVKLLQRGYTPKMPGMSSLGYSEILEHLMSHIPLEEVSQRIKHRTHRFARNQYGWFRPADNSIHWFQSTNLDIGAVVDVARKEFLNSKNTRKG